MRNIISKFFFTLLVLTMGIGQVWADTTLFDVDFSAQTNESITTSNSSATFVAKTYSGYNMSMGIKSGKPINIIDAGLEFTSNNYNSYTCLAIPLTLTANNKVTATITLASSGKVKYAWVSGSLPSTPNAGSGTAYGTAGTTNTLEYTPTSAGNYVLYLGRNGASDGKVIKSIVITQASSGGDVTAPTLSSSNPANGATDVAVNGTIVLTFSEAIASVDGSKFTLTGATKGTVAIDGTDATKVNVPYSGAANEATVTLATAAGAVSDASSNASAALSNISFTTVAAGGGGDPEPVCPTSGVIFSADVKVNSNQSFAAGSTTKISSDQADVTGGEIYAINEQGSNKNLIAPQSSVGYFCHTNNNTYFKIELECALAEGDRMTAKGYGGTKDGDPNNKGIWVSTATSRPSSAPAADGTSATASLLNPILDYTITSTDEYVGKKTIYVYRAAGASTYFDEFTITRPYAITFSSAKGSAPSATTGFQVTLEEITGVDGWTHTGWTANQTVKVGGEDKTAGTALAVDATAVVSSDVTFTATWEVDITKYKVTYYDGEAIPANKLGEEEVNEGGNPTGAGLTPKKRGYTFGGWSLTNGGAAIASYASVTVNEDKNLFVVWTPVDCPTNGVVFSFEMNESAKPSGDVKAPQKDILVIDEYLTISGLGSVIIGNTTNNTNQYSKVTSTPNINLNGATGYIQIALECALQAGDVITIAKNNSKVKVSDEVSASGPDGEVYSTATNAENVITVGTTSPWIDSRDLYIWYNGGGVTITSVTVNRPYTVTFNSNGGSDVTAAKVISGAKVSEPTAPTRDGYRFVKWQLSGVDYDFDATVTSSFTLDAVWQKTWTVTFNTDGGNSIDAATVDNGQAVAEPTAPTKGGFDFVEWQLSGSAYNFATPVTGDITLTATWQVAQDDASLSALSYNGNAIDVNSAVEVAGVQTYNVLLPWMVTPTVDPALISFTKNAETATVSTALAYDNESKTATFAITSGNGSVTVNYAIIFAFDVKRGASIIKATTNNVVTGLIGGSIDQSYSGTAGSRKLNKNNYFGIQLAEGNFQEGDVLIINITAAADLGNFMVYADAARTELLADQGITYTKSTAASPVICPIGEMRLVLPAAVNNHNKLYLSRENGDTQWNVTFSSLEVTREMNPIIKSFKFGDDAATINEAAKTISMDVPYGTDVTALTPTIVAYANNGYTYTPAGETDFTSPVDYVVTDGYNEFNTTYEVTVNVAAPSENANLASLAVAGYTLNFDPAVVIYNVVLDYGTTVLPEITYTVEDAGLATAEKVEGGVNGATTITVTPQAGVGYEKVYTINFSVSTQPKFVIFDGSKMTDIPAASGSDATTGFGWSMASGIPLEGSALTRTWNEKEYTHVVTGFKPNDNANNIVSIVIPENYFAKITLVGSTNSSGSERSMFLSTVASKSLAEAIEGSVIISSTYDAVGTVTDHLFPGTYYLCTTDNFRLFELSATLYHIDYPRDVTEGRYGTICLPNGGVMVGADLFEVAYYGATSQKIFFDQIMNGEMEAGIPYIFLPKEGVSQLGVYYTDAAGSTAGNRNGLYGSYTTEVLTRNDGNYVLYNNQYLYVGDESTNVKVGANRAYIKLAEITPIEPALAPGRRRVSMGVIGAPQVTTGVGELNADETPIKVMIDGQLYIIRGEKMYDATGRLVK